MAIFICVISLSKATWDLNLRLYINLGRKKGVPPLHQPIRAFLCTTYTREGFRQNSTNGCLNSTFKEYFKLYKLIKNKSKSFSANLKRFFYMSQINFRIYTYPTPFLAYTAEAK
jgi:hypothetical protein